MTFMAFTTFVLIHSQHTSCIWPPPYEIKLDQRENFVISEWSENDDNIINDEDEMIPPNMVGQSKEPDDGKYFRIHQLALRYNKQAYNTNNGSSENIKKIAEYNFDLDDAIPWEGGFVNKNGNFIQPENENVYYLNEMAKSVVDSKLDQKRENTGQNETEDKSENYDYNNFKMQYDAELEKNKKRNDTINFTNIPEDESFQEAVGVIVDFSEAKNCSAEGTKGIGLAALRCIIAGASNSTDSTGRVKKVLKIGVIWFCVYAMIAIPCWCQRGWCCCCCFCKICKPRQNIDEAKKYFLDNPVGVMHSEHGKKTEYQPTDYEIHAQKRLETALFNL